MPRKSRMNSLDDVRELTAEQLESYLKTGAMRGQPPAVWMWYVLEDAGISYVDLARMFDDNSKSMQRRYIAAIKEWLEGCDDLYIRYYERAHVQEEARPE